MVLDRRESATSREVREIFMMEGDFALRKDGPPRGEAWRTAMAGPGYVASSSRRLLGEPGVEEVFRMAAVGEEGCRLVRDQRFIKELVDMLGSWIEAQDLAVPA